MKFKNIVQENPFGEHYLYDRVHVIFYQEAIQSLPLEKLKIEFSDWSERIERLSEYMSSKGESYKNHLATIRSWSRREQKIIPKEPQTIQQLLKGIVKNGTSGNHSTEAANTSKWGELKGIIRL